MKFVKFDMHCHTAEGSMDGHVSVGEYIEILRSKGFGGMLVTDHDSYQGYLSYRRRHPEDQDFVVLRGIEYDTCDFGHMLVIMPGQSMPEVLEIKGLALSRLIKIVHYFGGIIGPAHPCGERFLSFYTTGIFKRREKERFLCQFDFLEGYNACEKEKDNRKSIRLAREYGLPALGGSDAHHRKCVGMGYTMLPDTVRTEEDLIACVKNAQWISCGGRRFIGTTRDKLGIFNKILVGSFFFYNKLGALYRLPARRRALYKTVYEMENIK